MIDVSINRDRALCSNSVEFARPQGYDSAMDFLIRAGPFLIAAVLVALGVVLFAGLYSMGRGGRRGSRVSNRMMRLRVALQGLAILVIVILAITQAR